MFTPRHLAVRRALESVRAADPVADADLLGRFLQSRDEAAFAQLVERHGPMVLGVCRRALHDPDAAEDAFQATFLALARGAGRLRAPGSVAAWLYGAAVRVSLKARRAAARASEATRRAPARVAPDPLAEITARELVGVIDAELARLPEQFRAVVVLCCLEGHTQEEAARRLGWSVGSVKGRLERGREQLRKRLAQRGVTLSAGLGAVFLGEARATVPPHLLARAVELAAGEKVPAGVAELAAGLAPSGTAWKLVAGVLVALAAGVFAVGRSEPPAQAAPPTPPPPAAAETVAAAPVDRFGDALPVGAVLRLGTTRLRHPRLASLAFAADGTLASFGGDYVVRIWEPASGRLLREREFERDPIERPRGGGWLSPDAKRVAVQIEDRVKVFDVGSGRELASVALTNRFDAIARFSPDGKQLAVADFEGKVQVCDVAANASRELAKLREPASLELAFSRDGRRLALANFNTGVVVWDLAAERELLRFRPRRLSPLSVDFDPTGDVLAVMGTPRDQPFHFVRVSTGREAEGWTPPPVGNLHWVRFSSDGSTLLLGGPDGISWFDPKTGKTIRTAANPALRAPAFSSDGRLVAAGGPNVLRIWDAATGRSAVPRDVDEAPADEVCGVAVSPDGKSILTKDADTGLIRIWDAAGTLTGTIRSNRWGGRYPLFSADGRHLYGMAPDAIALVRWDFPAGTESARYTFADPAADQVYVYNFALSADGRRLVALTQTVTAKRNESATVTVWETATGRRVESRRVAPFTYAGYGAFTPDLRWYVLGNSGLSVPGGKELSLELPAGWTARQAAASPDGRLVAQKVDERLQKKTVDGQPWYETEPLGVVVQEIATGKHVLTLPTGDCGPLAFAPDSRDLVVTGADGIVRWDLVTRRPIVRHAAPGRFRGFYGYSFASSLALTPDGSRAVTGQIDTTALVWDLAAPK
jgi:RNA polymerase sigma factor (sigma-70 family)